MFLHNIVSQPESQSGSAFLLAREERLKQVRYVLRGYALSAVGHSYVYPRSGMVGPLMAALNSQQQAALSGHSLNRVYDQIRKYLSQFSGNSPNSHPCPNLLSSPDLLRVSLARLE